MNELSKKALFDPAVKKKAASFPEEPGVYLMKDSSGEIIYVGKATSLKKRVLSYFRKNNQDAKTSILVSRIADIDFIITSSEIEALLLENNLIKKHRPRFNVRLKDDKRYPFIGVTLDEDYPRLVYTRRVFGKTNRFFGPYVDARAAKNMIELINTVFKLKTCRRDLPLRSGERPCINHQIQKCSGVCTGLISADEYRSIISNAVKFLEGGTGAIIEDLNSKMKSYSERMEYEKAASIRDIIQDIQAVNETQRVETNITGDIDYIEALPEGDELIAVIFEFRGGNLLGRKISVFENASLAEVSDVMRLFMLDYYGKGDVPGRIVTSRPVADRVIIESFLTERSSRRVRISPPVSANDRGVSEMVIKNAKQILADRKANSSEGNYPAAAAELMEVLGLDRPPVEIVCFDISNLQGTNSVASMSCFRDGKPFKSGYRRFKIRGYEGANDPGMIHEAVSRRVQHLVNEDIEPPDIMVIDGGITQLTRALEAVSNFDINIKVISIAKRFEELYYDPAEEPIRLPESSPALRVIQMVRDEAHRFAITYHRKLRAKAFTSSELDSIPGITENKKGLLFGSFHSVEAIKNAELDELLNVKGLGKAVAEAVYRFFNG